MACALSGLAWFAAPSARAGVLETFDLPRSGLELERPTRAGAFFDVVGRRSALFGYENRGFEAWVYPLKLLDDFRLSFRLEGYPLEIEASDIAVAISVRPEATVFTYSHPAFTVRQILYAPLDEPGVVMLLDVRSILPLGIVGSFKPRLRLMWPAGLMTGYVSWDEKERVYTIGEETHRFTAVIGAPGAKDLSVMPYQEEARDVPLRFLVEAFSDRGGAASQPPVPPPQLRRCESGSAASLWSRFIPIVFAGSVEGLDAAKATYARLQGSARALYEKNVAHYRSLLERTTSVETPDPRLDAALAWAKVGVDKGLATNPFLGTGLLAGFRTSGNSERPGFAWLFGRDALWTALATDAYGEFETSRTALEFLRKYQRADGKVPHEISQSASLIPWFTDYPYAWNSADATPLYVAAHADHWRATGDAAFLQASWESIVRAWRFTAATDTDGNGLVENGKFGHGWVEGGALYPAHEEIYLQGTWIEACRGLAEMAEARGAASLAAEARAAGERTRAALEKTYWIADRGFYGFATARPREKPPVAEPGPNRAVRQARLDALKDGRFVDENTVLPAVPMWWRVLDPARAQSEIDHLGGGAMATDWGARILSNRSPLYDPLSYHYGSVWPLFTGWTAMGAYRYGRPHVGYQALMANALLTEAGALGYVTELLSGDFGVSFGNSSHHQVWSEAMVATPLLRGLLGLEVGAAGRELTFAPQLPADWDHVTVRSVVVGTSRWDVSFERSGGTATVLVNRRSGDAALRLVIAPAFPLDARVRSVTVDGREAAVNVEREGDVQRARVVIEAAAVTTRLVFAFDEGTDAYLRAEAPAPGASNQGLRILRSRAQAGALLLRLEGLGGREYAMRVRTPRALGGAAGARVSKVNERDWEVRIAFEGAPDAYVRREITLPLR